MIPPRASQRSRPCEGQCHNVVSPRGGPVAAQSVLFLGGTGVISSACSALAVERGMEVFLLNRGTTTARPAPDGAVSLTGDANDTGHVKIYSEPGVGTTVKLYLPRHFGEAEAIAVGRRRRSCWRAPAAGEVVLVVEDEERVRPPLGRCPGASSAISCVHAGAPAAALALLAEQPARRSAVHRHRHARHGRAAARRRPAVERPGTQGALHHRLYQERHRP